MALKEIRKACRCQPTIQDVNPAQEMISCENNSFDSGAWHGNGNVNFGLSFAPNLPGDLIPLADIVMLQILTSDCQESQAGLTCAYTFIVLHREYPLGKKETIANETRQAN